MHSKKRWSGRSTRRALARGGDRASRSWSQLSPLLVLIAACGFPRPTDVADSDASTGCVRDEDCGGSTPFCAGGVCAICKASTSCPASRPVCDTASHDCRTCAEDSECDSGACDLAAGTCVGQSAILYASPTGSAADLCTRMSPCSLRRAAELVDATHAYVVLQPGHHAGGAQFSAKKAFLIGDNASIDVTDSVASPVDIFNGSSISIRNVSVNEHLTIPGTDLSAVIGSYMSELTIDNMQSNTETIFAVAADKVTIRHSEFTGYAVQAARLIAEGCTFHTEGPRITGSVEISNSIIHADFSRTSIFLYKPADGTSFISKITNNTFVGGTIYCEPTTAFSRIFDSNILYDLGTISAVDGCTYQYNLITRNPNVSGTGNMTGDPLFMDIANNDFHLRPGSPAIDAANPASTSVNQDFDGTHRPQGPRSDIGAFEYVP